MQSSYAVYWNEGSGVRHAGRFDLEAGYAQLVGRAGRGTRRRIRIPFVDIASVGYRSGRLRLERRTRPPLEIGSVEGPGVLHELADRLQAAALPA